MGYRILFTDLDGTLLNSKSELTPASKEAVSAAFAAGRQVVLCSGRSWRSLDYFEKQLGMTAPDRYGVSFNGGLVYETLSKKFLYERPMDNETGIYIANTLRAMGAFILIYANDLLIAESETPFISAYSRHVGIPVKYLNDFNEIGCEIMKIIIKGPNEELKSIAQNTAPLFAGRCGVFFSSDDLLEFSHPLVHKGRGMRFLSDYLGIPREEVIAVGDQANDIDMLRDAGLGIAVSNAVPEVKAAADVVLEKSNDTDAVAYVIQEWLLK